MKRISTGEGFIVPPRPARVSAAETPKGPLASSLVVFAIIVAGLFFAREVLIPIAIAVLLSFVLGPLVNFLRRLKLGRAFAVLVSVLLAAGIIAAVTTVIGVQVAELAQDVPRYQRTVERKIEGLRAGTLGQTMDYIANINRAIHQSGEESKESAEKAKQQAARDSNRKAEPEPPKPLLVQVEERRPGPLELATTVLAPVAQPLATAGIVFVVLLFILMQREDLRDRLIRLAGSSDLHRTTVAMDDAARRLSRYFLGQLALNSAFGVVIGVGLWIIGVPSPVLWGIFALVMRFVPYIGAFLSAVLPIALAAAVDPGWSMVLSTFLLFALVEPIVGQIIEPLVYGHSTGVSPFSVLVSALFWTWLWGPVGLLLSTPLTVCLVVLGRHVDRLEFLDVLFSNRPALTPIENFYQRMLADDPEEAQEHADLILRECSLSAYYDDVVLKGLELASRDAARGVLTPSQKDEIRASITALVEDLEDREDAVPDPASKPTRLFDGAGAAGDGESACKNEPIPDPDELPAAWQADGAVLLVSGRGFLDGAATAIADQLLRKRGFGTRQVPFAEVARVRIAEWQPGPAQAVCVISLALSGEPTHLRRLVSRLRQKIDTVPIVAGLWRLDEPMLADDAVRAKIGADDHVTSLRDLIETILALARNEGGPDRSERNDAATPPRQALPEPA
ncbi:UNVERIFIED_ORG: putative PurR-regulated permease PerM [Methylobacterium sp. SuP10 SLI 274]|uniref:AI-2E family transporter n=1 Tax=Methylorubrum extorquens TaxID=408 RepID=UPI0020A1A0CF|nr:AI-2E family transporter [Methylorubrum extorquens]MDF9862926.1 putative PurR-regulated permease PerM [Methylorubrum pseudosasae]MDH6636536.1 putative PurR-regulated permease PerM [Methylobacterium sp. SuP10 SLI 274]MDH6665717.1 putative PurR-regulated permease PerM [Methylorubrum zatmanii]MCP1557632.1 putative PurR-regulated permease PerM [Methylorubrum extorquens]MDF9791221.1 putative PurR-regulated permease PerM [Methylorubrum extorquens]